MLNKESAIVRYKTVQYINALEDRLTAKTLAVALEKKDEDIKRLERLIGLRTKDKFSYGKIIKEHLGIRRVNDDYNAIKYMFFHELNISFNSLTSSTLKLLISIFIYTLIIFLYF